MRRQRRRRASVVLWLGMALPTLCAPDAAQAPGDVSPGLQSTGGQQRTWYTLGRAATPTGSPVVDAHVAVYLDDGATPIEQLKTNFQGEFEISLNVDSTKSHSLKVVATKDGYLDARETADLTSHPETNVVELVLQSKQDDPGQLPFETLISAVTARLLASAGVSPAGTGRVDTMRRAQALLDAHDPNGTLRLLVPALERDSKCAEFRTLSALAMLEMGSWSSATRQLTEVASLNTPTEPKGRRSEPHLVLGVLQCWRGNPEKATEFFLQGLNLEPDNPLLHQELGRAYLLRHNWPGAEQSFARAIQAGAPPEAHLLRAQALLAAARPADAQTECQTYLGGRKPRQLPTPVRMWWVDLNNRLALEVASAAGAATSLVKKTPAELSQSLPEVQGLEPANSQEELSSILEQAGERVEAFFRDFHNTNSREEVRQELLHRGGKVKESLHYTYRYLLVSWPDSSRPSLEEYRTDRRGGPSLPGQSHEGFMLTKGFASVSNVFLPAYQPDSTFVYLGRQHMEGHETDVVVFAQRPEAARLLGSFTASNRTSVEVLSQGVAWIDRNTHQIIRMRTDLLSPRAEARLDRETTEIHYAEVRFQEVPVTLWLPRDVAVTVECNGKLLRNQHSYSDFHLYNVHSKIIVSPEPGQEP